MTPEENNRAKMVLDTLEIYASRRGVITRGELLKMFKAIDTALAAMKAAGDFK